MASASYYERERVFYKMRRDLEFVLSHPEFEAPDHPYVHQLQCMSHFAIFGVIDTQNGILHPGTTVFRDSVVVAPVLQADMKVGKVSVGEPLMRRVDIDEVYDFTALRDGSGNCDASDVLMCPIISLAPYMNERHPLVVGPTFLHELDHVYWWLRRRHNKYKHYDPGSEECIAAQEISANRLEQQVYFAHTPQMYDDEYGNISLKYADGDFGRPFSPRNADKLRKSVRVIAFINYMFDRLGADVGVRPTGEVIEALKVQGLM